MFTSLMRRFAILAVLVLIIAACVPATPVVTTPTRPGETPIPETGEEPTGTVSPVSPGGEPIEVPEVIQFGETEWPMANKDYTNARAALNALINSTNIDQLGVAWTFPIPGMGAYGAASSNPLIAGGTVYFQDTGSNVFALDLLSGEVLWEQMYELSVVGPNGPAIGYGKVFAQVGSNSVRALDIETGEEVWSTELEHPTGAQQPYVFDGHVYTGTLAGVLGEGEEGGVALRGYAGGASGYAYALDQETGEVAWNFMVVEEGFWGNEEVNSGGGIWYPPAIDVETGLTYWGTGNPAPFPGTVDFPNASSRLGPNLYTNSVIALDHQTGELAWYNYLNPDDLFDHDAQISPVLGTAEIDGEQRKIVIGSGKLGVVVAMDAESGETIWSVEVGEHQNDDLQQVPEGETITVLPGVYGGVETPMALAEGVLYVPVVNLPSPFTATGFEAESGTEAVQNIEGRTDLSEGSGLLTAIDISSGVVLWRHDFDQIPFGGATVVNDLVIVPTFDGVIHALLRSDGSEVWSWQAPAGIIAWPAVTGDTLVIPAGTGSQPLLIALRLGAEGQLPTSEPTEVTEMTPTEAVESPTPTGAAESPTPTGPAVTPSATQEAQAGNGDLIAMGEDVYLSNCSRCHGPNGMGAGGFPSLAGNPFVTGEPMPVILQVLHGGGGMPAFADQLSNEEIASVVSYIRNTWENNASTVAPDQVEEARSQ